MTEIVSSFLPVRAAAFQYIFLLCNESHYTTWIQDALDNNATLFGEDLGIKAKIVQAYRHQSTETHKEVRSKPPHFLIALIQRARPPLNVVPATGAVLPLDDGPYPGRGRWDLQDDVSAYRLVIPIIIVTRRLRWDWCLSSG